MNVHFRTATVKQPLGGNVIPGNWKWELISIPGIPGATWETAAPETNQDLHPDTTYTIKCGRIGSRREPIGPVISKQFDTGAETPELVEVASDIIITIG